MTFASPRWLNFFLSLLLLACAVAPFTRIGYHDFVPFDDDIEITDNSHLRGLGPAEVGWMFTDTQTTQRYTPLSWVAWALLYEVWGLNPAPFHLEALIVHALNAVLVLFVVRCVLERASPGRDPRVLSLVSALGAALWALHPMGVEVVNWITQVRFAEAATFALVSTLCYFQFAGSSGRRRRVFFWGAVASYGISVLFYPSGIGLPLVFLAADVFPLRQVAGGRGLGAAVVGKWPFWIAAVGVGGVTLAGRFTQSTVFHGPTSLAQFGLASRLMQALYIFAYYLWKPFDLSHFSPVYTQLVSFIPVSWPFLLSAGLVVGLSAAAIACRRRFPALAVLWIAHLALIFPVGGYLEHPHYPSDRYGYLQSVLLAIALSAALLGLWGRAPALTRAAFVGGLMLVLAAFISIDRAQSGVWTNGETLFKFMIADLGSDPYVADIHWRLGNYYLAHRQPERAIPEYEKTLAFDPENSLVLRLRAASLLELARKQRRE